MPLSRRKAGENALSIGRRAWRQWDDSLFRKGSNARKKRKNINRKTKELTSSKITARRIQALHLEEPKHLVRRGADVPRPKRLDTWRGIGDFWICTQCMDKMSIAYETML